jgi:4-amino-4-deoxy-L-arabinose transferase-like glycosyltransferase
LEGSKRTLSLIARHAVGPVVLAALTAPWIAWGTSWDPDETRYLEIPREMVETGDWVIPRLNYVFYLEKPPLYYWMVAAAYKVVGTTPVAARLVSLLCGIGVVWLTAALGRMLWDRGTGTRAGLILATCPFVVVLSSIVTIDMPFVFFVTAGITALVSATVRSQRGEAPSRSQDLLCLAGYALLGLAVMTKGPVALVAPTLLWVFWLGRRRRPILPPRFFVGSAVFLAVCAPWFIHVGSKFPQFVEFFFVRGHLARLSPGDGPAQINLHSQPFYVYLPVLLGGGFPWALWLVAPWRTLRQELEPRSASRLAWSWLVPGFVFFSLVSAKLPTYILPLFPPMALLAARHWEDAAASRLPDRFLRGMAVAIVAAMLLMIALTWWTLKSQADDAPRIGVIDQRVAAAASCFFLACAVLASFRLLARRTRAAFGILIAMAFSVAIFGAALKAPIDRAECLANLMPTLCAVRRPDEPVVCAGKFLPSVPFALGAPALIYRDRGELAFGSQTLGSRPDLFLSLEHVREWSAGPTRIFFTVRARKLEGLEKELGMSLHVLGRRGGVLLVSNRAQPWPDENVAPRG